MKWEFLRHIFIPFFKQRIDDKINHFQYRNNIFIDSKLAMAQVVAASMDYRYYSPAKPIVRAEIKSQSTEFNTFRDKNIEE